MTCKYCFYNDELSHNTAQIKSFMSIDTFTCLIDKVFSDRFTDVSIMFQGGEPTLIGIDFFKESIKIVNSLNKNNASIHYAIQTNGLLLDTSYADFFKENNFLVGLSLDGNKKIHDTVRIKGNNEGSFNTVFQNARLLESKGVEFNILSVVTKPFAKNIKEIFEFYTRNNFMYQQYIPCIDAICSERGEYDWSVTPEQYAKFLKTLFDLWYKSFLRGKPVVIRYFENILALLLDRVPESCGMLGQCSLQYVIEADGTVYPCDFYVLPEYAIGNILTNTLSEIDSKRKEIRFIEKSCDIHKHCKKCTWLKLCRGGCRRDRENFATNTIEKNYFCESYKDFFEYSFERFEKMAIFLKNN